MPGILYHSRRADVAGYYTPALIFQEVAGLVQRGNNIPISLFGNENRAFAVKKVLRVVASIVVVDQLKCPAGKGYGRQLFGASMSYLK